MTLYATWPVRLEGEIPVELCSVGRIVRTEEMKAVLHPEKSTFAIAG